MSRLETVLEQAALRRQGRTAEPAAPDSHRAARSLDRLLEAEPLAVTSPYVPTVQAEHNQVVNEEFRKLRSQLIRLTRGEVVRNTLLVASAMSGEGKSISALNLAVSLAQEFDYSVLLVDADLRKPSLHQYLGITPEIGLIQCLRGEARLEDALVRTGLGKLVLLPAGGSVPNPVELLSSSRMKELVRELKQRYQDRYVIFDVPPALPFADAQVLSETLDGVLFVVREGWGKLAGVRQALEGLDADKLLGLIYNDCRHSEGYRNGHYAYYG